MYYLMGKLTNGSRIHMDILSSSSLDKSGCDCKGIPSSTPILGEAVTTKQNLTILLVNTCNCKVLAQLRLALQKLSATQDGNACLDILFCSSFEGSVSFRIAADWAAILDEDGLYELSAPSWSSFTQTVPLTPHSLFVASYQISSHFWFSGLPVKHSKSTSVHLDQNTEKHNVFHVKDSHLVHNKTNAPYQLNKTIKQYGFVGKLDNRFPLQPSSVIQFHSAFPAKSFNIMRRIPSSASCDYTLSVVYDASRAIRHVPQLVMLKIGFLGWAGLVDWTMTFKCDCYYSFSFCSEQSYKGTNSSSSLYDSMKYSVRRPWLIATVKHCTH